MAVPGAAVDAIVPPGVTAAEVAPSPTSVPEAVSSGPAGNEFRGACPYRTFSRFTFCGFCGLVAAVAVAVGIVEVVGGVAGAVAAAVGAATGAAVAGAAVDADAGAAAVLVAVENFVPRSNRFFC